MTVENFKTRLVEFYSGHLKMSQNKFEDACQIAKGNLSQIKTKGPSVDMLQKISSTFPELNLNWLIAGRGEMLIGGEMPAKAPILPQNRTEPPKAINYPSVSVQNVQAVFVTNWQDVASVVEQTVKNVMGKQ